jgi:hypothetical protein
MGNTVLPEDKKALSAYALKAFLVKEGKVMPSMRLK